MPDGDILSSLDALAAIVPADLLLYVVDLAEPVLADKSKKLEFTLLKTYNDSLYQAAGSYQPLDADLTTIAGLAHADGNFIVSDGAAWTVESGATARASLGLGTLAVINSPLPIINGGSGQTTQQAAIDALTAVAGATIGHVLTKSAGGIAAWEAPTGGGGAVDSVFTRTGAVVAVSGDYTAAQVTNVPAGNIAAVTVQAAIDELDSEKAGLALANVFTAAQAITRNYSGAETGASLLNITSTWNTTGVLDGLNFAITNTASHPNSSLFTMTVPGSVSFKLKPTGLLEMQAASTSTVNDGRNTTSMIYLINTNTTANNFSTILFGDANNESSAWIACKYIDHTNNYGDVLIGTRGTSGIATRLYINSNGLVGIGDSLSSPVTRLHVQEADTVNNAVTNVLTLDHTRTGATAGANDIGTGLLFRAETTVNNTIREIGRIQASFPTATDASRKGRVVFTAYDTAEREGIRIEASGTAPMLGFYGSAAVAQQTVTGSRGGNAALADLLTKLATLGLIVDGTSV